MLNLIKKIRSLLPSSRRNEASSEPSPPLNSPVQDPPSPPSAPPVEMKDTEKILSWRDAFDIFTTKVEETNGRPLSEATIKMYRKAWDEFLGGKKISPTSQFRMIGKEEIDTYGKEMKGSDKHRKSSLRIIHRIFTANAIQDGK